MPTTILSNGSKWAGQEPDPVERLLEVLRGGDILDPRFEPFAAKDGMATVRFFGNFLTVSHVFDIRSDDPDVCERLVAAIKTNMAGVGYAGARMAQAVDAAGEERRRLGRLRR